MRKFLSLLLTLFGLYSVAQQDPQFTQNMFNQLDINPGFAGSNDAICATLLGRQQWLGFKDIDGNKGAPQTYLLSVDGYLKPIHGGLGLTICQDKVGFENNLSVKLGYAYRRNIGTGNIGIGLNVGFLNKSIDFTKFKPIDNTDPLLYKSGTTNLLSNSDTKAMIPDLNFGVYYSIPNKIYFGVSTSQLIQNKATFDNTNIDLKRHYYVTAGYNYPIPSNPSFEVAPSFFIKSDGTATQFDVNCLVEYNKKFWGGLTYRIQDAVGVLIGMNWQDFRIGYSYDITTSAIGSNGRSSGSHEIMLGYCFKIKTPESVESYKNVRFL
ncbi:MAG: type IX secretion system membrane protein PorP/SprF [Bacteroidota bacterium]|nr:type IX secretion system membrane protein PorP/SprF [Bacteroidota bacterium]